MNVEDKIPVKEGLWALNPAGEVRLTGSWCAACRDTVFPRKENGICTNCQHDKLEEVFLSNEGEITAYTVVHQPPAGGSYKGPVPFAYGFVRLKDGTRVQTLFSNDDLEKLEVGKKALLVLERLFENEDGEEIITYKFKIA